MDKETKILPIAFLGVCDKYSLVRNLDPRLSAINILGLRSQVFSSVFPLSLQKLQIVVSIFEPASLGKTKITCSTKNQKDVAWWELDFAIIEEAPSDSISEKVTFLSKESSWYLFVFSFPETSIINSPQTLSFFIKEAETELPIGSVDLLYAPAIPFTPDRIAAIKSDPQAIKVAKMNIACKECKDSMTIFTALEENDLPEDAVWYKKVPDEFICTCKKTVIDLRIIRESFHSVLGERMKFEEDQQVDHLSISRLYESVTLDNIYKRFYSLLERNPEEEEVQIFLEENPILFHKFVPARIIKKAPILNKFNTDFAILSKTGELFLIEIEKPGKRILKENGDRSQEFNHPFDQVQDWFHIMDEHRIACLEMMGLKSDQVTSVRGVVIIGRDEGNAHEHLRKIKATDFGRKLFMTYDDFIQGLEILIREMNGL